MEPLVSSVNLPGTVKLFVSIVPPWWTFCFASPFVLWCSCCGEKHSYGNNGINSNSKASIFDDATSSFMISEASETVSRATWDSNKQAVLPE